MTKQKSGFQTNEIIFISIAHWVHDIFTSFFAPILPLLIDKLGLSFGMVGFLSVIQRAPSLLNPFIGLVVDRFSLRWLLIVAPTISAICMSLLGLAQHWSVLALLLVGMGIGSTLFHVPAPGMIKEIAGRQTGKGMSYFMVGGELARTIGPIVILGAVTAWGLEGTWRLIPIGIAASVVLWIKLRAVIQVRPSKKNGNTGTPLCTLKRIIPFLVVISGVLFFRALMKSALTVFLPTYIEQTGAGLWAGGGALAVLQLAGAGGTFLSGQMSDHLGRRKVLLIVTIANPVLMLLFTFVSGIWMIPLLISMGFVMFASGPVILALVQDLNTDQPAFVNGVYFTISFGIGSAAALFVGILADQIGLEAVYRWTAFLSLGAIPFVMMISRLRMDQDDDQTASETAG